MIVIHIIITILKCLDYFFFTKHEILTDKYTGRKKRRGGLMVNNKYKVNCIYIELLYDKCGKVYETSFI